jgi:hypothetical protein
MTSKGSFTWKAFGVTALGFASLGGVGAAAVAKAGGVSAARRNNRRSNRGCTRGGGARRSADFTA